MKVRVFGCIYFVLFAANMLSMQSFKLQDTYQCQIQNPDAASLPEYLGHELNQHTQAHIC